MACGTFQSALFHKKLKKKYEVNGVQFGEVLNVRGRLEKNDSKNKSGARSKSKEGNKKCCFVCVTS